MLDGLQALQSLLGQGEGDVGLLQLPLAVADALVEGDDGLRVGLLKGELPEVLQLGAGTAVLILEVRGADRQALDLILRPTDPRLAVQSGPALQPGPQLGQLDVGGHAGGQRAAVARVGDRDVRQEHGGRGVEGDGESDEVIRR